MADYDTPLAPEDQQAFQAWARAGGRDPEQEKADYDLQGYYASTGGAPLGQGHLTDQFKKPSHPTFSTESKYHGVDGNEGGQWQQTGQPTADRPQGVWSFTPGKTNLENWGPQGLRHYFDTYEKGNQLLIPPEAN